jgi:hypothetical protein
MATDEGVLGRSLGLFFARDGNGHLPPELAQKLYTIHRFESAKAEMHLIFRDHTISDLVGFVYSGMAAQQAAQHLMQNIRSAAQPILDAGQDVVVPIILDGENAWEYYPKSGREFLRRFYDSLSRERGLEAVTVSEAIARHRNVNVLPSLVPGSWINANFNVWIGAPEDNRAWDYLSHARNFYEETAPKASEEQRKLAFEEILIAEGSDWNWWYGPEHHSANDQEFDELYRKHLSNVYQALGATPPDYLAQPIIGSAGRPSFSPQTAYIHPHIRGEMVRYFEWMGAAVYTSDRRSGSMHGKQFLLDSVYAGIDENMVYGRLDFAGAVPDGDFDVVVNIESWAADASRARRTLRLDITVRDRKMGLWSVTQGEEWNAIASFTEPRGAVVALKRNLEFGLPLSWLLAVPVSTTADPARVPASVASRLRVRFSLWQNRLPVDALPVEGWIELHLVSEAELESAAY